MKKLLNFVKSLCKKLRGVKSTKSTIYKLKLKYFDIYEFDSPDEVGSGLKMDKKFLEKLDYARHNAGIPFKINSGYRTKNWNDVVIKARVGSSHKKGLAADIKCIGSRNRYLIINSLMDVGINRIGIGKTFIHCDVDKEKDQDVIWLYN